MVLHRPRTGHHRHRPAHHRPPGRRGGRTGRPAGGVPRRPARRPVPRRGRPRRTAAHRRPGRARRTGRRRSRGPVRRRPARPPLFLGRTLLRTHLKDLVSDSRSRVLLVTGPRSCGKSHTWYFVSHVAQQLRTFRPVLVDLAEWADGLCTPTT
ncbi:hypothetical protein ACFQ1I_39025 [Kitasatospora arboriphila]